MISMDASQAAFLVIAVSSNLRPPRTICWAEPVLILKAHVLALPAVRWVLVVSSLSGGLAVLTSSCGFLGRCYQRISHVLSYVVCISSTSTLGNTNTIRMYYIYSAHDFSLLHTSLAFFRERTIALANLSLAQLICLSDLAAGLAALISIMHKSLLDGEPLLLNLV